MWFIAPLFYREVMYGWIRKYIPGGYLIDLGFIAIGFVLILPFATEGYEAGLLCTVFRTAHFLAWFSLGRIYRDFIEQRTEHIQPFWLFVAYLAIQYVVTMGSGGDFWPIIGRVKLPAGLWTIAYMLDGVLGYLLIGRVLEPVARRSRTVGLLSKNTFAIMCHHIFGFFLMMSLLALLSIFTPWFNTFDMASYLVKYSYLWFPKGHVEFCWAYVMASIAFAIWFQGCLDRACNRILNSKLMKNLWPCKQQ